MTVYGVSYGNGNDGVSQSFPDFYCETDKPYDLARLAIITNMSDKWMDWAAEEVQTDGEEDYTIYATLYEGPDGETEFGAAWLIAEVFPSDYEADPSDPWAKQVYASLEDCFGASIVAKYADKA